MTTTQDAKTKSDLSLILSFKSNAIEELSSFFLAPIPFSHETGYAS